MAYTVGIDGNEANVENRVGSNVYAFEVLHALHAWLAQEKKFSVIVYLAEDPREDMPAARADWQYVIVPKAPLWTLWRLPLELWTHKQIDLFFSPGHYLPSSSPVPMIPTIMDIAFELFPDQFKTQDYWQLHLLTQRSVDSAQHILAISEATKRDVIQQYGRSVHDVTVAYPGGSDSLSVPKQSRQKELLQSREIHTPYILYVGTIQPRKNIERLIGAFESVRTAGWKGELVLAGKIGWKSEGVLQRIETSPEKAHIRQLGFVSDEEKTALIAQSACLALVGLYEGFGIPPLEAIQLGTLPVVSKVSSLPEVVGTEGVVVDPYSVEDISRGLQEVLNFSAAEKKQKLQSLQSHVAQFTWKRTGEVVGNVLWESLTNTRVM